MSSVYLQRFNLERQPFALLPDTDFFFEGEQRGALLRGLRQALRDDAGLCVVAGEVGTGKTMLCRMLGRQLAQDEFDVAFIPDASLPREALLAGIAADLGMPCEGPGGPALALQQALLARSLFDQRLVLLIDEAHTLQPQALDAVRMLMNVETGQCKLLQIVLFGQPELHTLLRRPDLRQVRDRISHTFELAPLSSAGAQAYLEHRLRTAGWNGERLLEPEAVAALVRRGAGRFRALGLLADKALLAAYAEGARSVAASHVARAWQELQRGAAAPWQERWRAGARRLAAPAGLTTLAQGALAALRLPAFTAPRAAAVLSVAMVAALAVPLGERLGRGLSQGGVQAQAGTAAPLAAAKPMAGPRVSGTLAQAGATNYDALVAHAPPAAAMYKAGRFYTVPDSEVKLFPTPAAKAPKAATVPAAPIVPAAAPGGYHTVVLASAPSQAAARDEARRLAAQAGLKPTFVLHRPGRDPSRPPSATPWVVCSGQFASAQEAQAAQARLGPALAALRPRVLKVES